MKKRFRIILYLLVGALAVAVLVAAVSIGQQIRQNNLNRALIRALKNIDAPAAERLLDQGANANAIATDAQPPTIWDTIRRLLDHTQGQPASEGASAMAITMNDSGWYTGPTTACDNVETALLQHGADIDTIGDNGETPLDDAAAFGYHRTVDYLLAHGANVKVRNEAGETPLIGADAYATAALLKHGADVNARDYDGQSALKSTDDIEVAKTLIEHGADVNAVDNAGQTVLDSFNDALLTSDQRQIVALLLRHGAHRGKHVRPIHRTAPAKLSRPSPQSQRGPAGHGSALGWRR